MTDIAADLRPQLAKLGSLTPLAIDTVQVSSDGTRKVKIRTHDDRFIETVLIPDGDKVTQCVSSQVGCALDCTFCATATLGFGRNLTAGEIVDQVYRAEQLLAALPADDPTCRSGADHITNLVFMGMGEPLHNYANLIRSLRILTDPLGQGFSRRRITVSTAGLVPAIEKLAKEDLRVNLAISLNASNDEVRDELMPINRKYPI